MSGLTKAIQNTLLIVGFVLIGPAQAQTVVTPPPVQEDWWNAPERTNPHLRFQPLLQVARILPLIADPRQPDALVFFMKNSLGNRIIIAQINADDRQKMALTSIDPQASGPRIRHSVKRTEAGENAQVIADFRQIQKRGPDPLVVCIDGPEWYFSLRSAGQVTTGRVETCNRPQMEALGEALVAGTPFNVRGARVRQ